VGRYRTACRLGTVCVLSGFLAISTVAYGGLPVGLGVAVVGLVAFVSKLGDVMDVGTPRNAKSFQELGSILGTFGRWLVVPYAALHVGVASHVKNVIFVGRCG